MENIILGSNAARNILFNLNKSKISYASKIALEISIPRAYATNLVSKLFDLKLVEEAELNNKGKSSKQRKYLKLSEKGYKVVQALLIIGREIN